MESFEEKVNSRLDENGEINVKDILDLFWRLKWWIVGAMFAALLLGFIYVRLQTPTYERTAAVMLSSGDSSTSSELALLSDLSGRRMTRKIDNEVYILKSPSLMQRVVEELGLETRYYRYFVPIGNGHIHILRGLFDVKRGEYYNDNPFALRVENDPLYPDELQPQSIYIKFKNRDSQNLIVKKMTINGKKVREAKGRYAYGEAITVGAHKYYVDMLLPAEMIDGDIYECVRNSSFRTAQSFLTRLDAAVVQGSQRYANASDVVALTMTDAIPRRAEDILNTLITKDNEEARAFSSQTTRATVEFIDSRLEEISKDLGDAETQYKNYQASSSVVDITSQSQLALTSDQAYQDQLNEVRMQLRILD
nr:hypothetical protein [Bacteroidales bacterium]